MLNVFISVSNIPLPTWLDQKQRIHIIFQYIKSLPNAGINLILIISVGTVDLSPTHWHRSYKIGYYNDVIMGAITSQITNLTIVYSTVYLDADKKKTSKLRVAGICAGNSPGTGEFPAQMVSSAEFFSIWWRHHVLKRVWLGPYIVTERWQVKLIL